MLIHEKIKVPLLAGALALALLPTGAGAAGGGGHMGGGASFHAMTPPRTAPNVPGVGPGQRAQSGARATSDIGSHAVFPRPQPVTGTRIPAPQHPFVTPDPSGSPALDPPPPGHGEEQ